MEDFEKELKEWIVMGDHIVVAGDMNDNVFHADVEGLFA